MKLALLHGPAISSSRKKLIELKQKFDTNNIVVFEKGADYSRILASLQTVPMFEENRLIVVENPLENMDFDSLTPNDSLTLILWYDHEIKNIPKSAQVLFFPEVKEVSVFPFLDKLGAKEKSAFLEMDKLKKAGFDSQYIITMIFYLLRNLVATPKNAKDFVKVKFAKMRKNFSATELVNLYKFTLATDFKIKSGVVEEAQAEFILVNKFLG